VGGEIELRGVFNEHSVCVETRSELTDGASDASDPASGDPCGGVCVVELRDYLVLEEPVERVALKIFALIVGHVVIEGADAFDVVADVGVEAFVPPAVEGGEIDDTVHGGFHAGGAGGFKATDGGVEPGVAATNELSSDFDVVVFEEDDAVFNLMRAGELDDVADEAFAARVAGVRFAGDDELNGARAADEFEDTLGIAEEEGAAFVSGEAASETDGEDVWMEQARGGGGIEVACAAREEGGTNARPAPVYEGLAAELASVPEIGVGDVVDAFPGAVVVRGFLPSLSSGGVKEASDEGADPTGSVDAVGDVADGNVVAGSAGPDIFPHAA